MKKLFTAIFLLVFIMLNVYAQGNTPPVILLNKYTFSSSDNVVGVISIHPARIQASKISLKGPDAHVFSIDKANKLSIKFKYNKPEAKWYDIRIEAETSSGKLKADFRIVNDEFIRNKVIAHRGAWKHTGAAQNSIAALQHAIRLGCEGSEFDVHMTTDSALYIYHDAHMGDVYLEKSSSAELDKLKLPTGENLPSLDAYLREGMIQNRTKLILEMKPSVVSKDRGVAFARKAVQKVREMKAQAWVDYISFDYDMCREVLRLDPFARVAYLNGDKSPEELRAAGFYGLDYNQNVYRNKPALMTDAQERRLTINVWTVNDEQSMNWFLTNKADFITTDEPELLLKKVAR